MWAEAAHIPFGRECDGERDVMDRECVMLTVLPGLLDDLKLLIAQ